MNLVFKTAIAGTAACGAVAIVAAVCCAFSGGSAPLTGSADCPAVGATCGDGTIYAGISENGTDNQGEPLKSGLQPDGSFCYRFNRPLTKEEKRAFDEGGIAVRGDYWCLSEFQSQLLMLQQLKVDIERLEMQLGAGANPAPSRNEFGPRHASP